MTTIEFESHTLQYPCFLSSCPGWPLNFRTDKTLMMTRQSGIRSSPSSLSTLLRIFLPPTLSSFFLFQLNLINRDSFKALFRLHCTKTQVQFGSLHSALARYFTLYIATPPYAAADTLTDWLCCLPACLPYWMASSLQLTLTRDYTPSSQARHANPMCTY